MKHQTLEQLHEVAQVEISFPAMTRRERLEHWATLLERNPERCLAAFPGTEYMTLDVRNKAQSFGSALGIAFADPMLRAQGLKSETYGEAKRFFELTDWQLHAIVCHCHVGGTMKAGWAAVQVRSAIDKEGKFFTRLREAISHWALFRILNHARE
ncbi:MULTISPECIES: hypothetical protein [unclassified Mesorhizobium]|uniref:hypothetical protein n=1 Tax=unclassified Mesorhizobium TaxID=325217 RepID=UPI000FD945DF|nr:MULTISPECIES: hypothetical protein [unclassified Mesorhizobium]TGQ04133.1 hypothetical protein EN862_034010 [Mesorhizobium sp. M2E.F.Ca.ET.219.01.1.1]TGT63326.1 hypothetical protein EN809_035665 [Mesorhizobium sp. M2E.F.Ca.ET.166.01.1.1]TGV96951.1 hypothetical protein EN797_035665 [Mesorhizobium sp. M2E.F.Ca.ET.154.01.1.1]